MALETVEVGGCQALLECLQIGRRPCMGAPTRRNQIHDITAIATVVSPTARTIAVVSLISRCRLNVEHVPSHSSFILLAAHSSSISCHVRNAYYVSPKEPVSLQDAIASPSGSLAVRPREIDRKSSPPAGSSPGARSFPGRHTEYRTMSCRSQTDKDVENRRRGADRSSSSVPGAARALGLGGIARGQARAGCLHLDRGRGTARRRLVQHRQLAGGWEPARTCTRDRRSTGVSSRRHPADLR